MRRKNDFPIFRFLRNVCGIKHILILYVSASCSMLIVLSLPLAAQTTNQDSLLNVVKTLPDDTNKVNTLQLIASNYLSRSRDYNKMGEFAWKGLALSQKLNYEKGIANAYSCIGIWCWYNGYFICTQITYS